MACKQDIETELIICPYDQSHLIMRKRFQVHLGRCRRNHKNSRKVVCPFNVTHLVNKEELEWHASICVDRLTFETYKQREVIAGTVVEPTKPEEPVIDCAENWDDDPQEPTYKPELYALQAKVLRTLQGVTRSEQKQFRAAERKRFKILEAQQAEKERSRLLAENERLLAENEQNAMH